MKQFGKGTVAWLPWNLGSLYYLHSSEAHARLMRDLIDRLLPHGRQLRTNAHPLVEITYVKQGDHHLVQLVNLSGHSQTGYFDPIPMTNIDVQVRGAFRSAREVRLGRELKVSRDGAYAGFTVPELGEYEMIELQ